MLGDVARLVNASGRELGESRLQPEHLAGLLDLLDAGTLSTTLARSVLDETFASGKAPADVVKEQGVSQITDAASIEPVVQEAIDANGAAVADYLKGKDTAIRFLVGQVMKLTRGQANPEMVAQLLKEKLDVMRQK